MKHNRGPLEEELLYVFKEREQYSLGRTGRWNLVGVIRGTRGRRLVFIGLGFRLGRGRGHR